MCFQPAPQFGNASLTPDPILGGGSTNRIYLTMAGLVLSCATFAGEGFLGTKPSQSPITTATSGASASGGSSLLQVAIALCVVYALIRYVAPLLIQKAKALPKSTDFGGLKVVNQVQVATATVATISTGDRTFLVGVGAQTVTLLQELTESKELPKMLTFQELVETSPPQPEFLTYKDSEPVAAGPSNPLVNDQIERLNRLLR